MERYIFNLLLSFAMIMNHIQCMYLPSNSCYCIPGDIKHTSRVHCPVLGCMLTRHIICFFLAVCVHPMLGTYSVAVACCIAYTALNLGAAPLGFTTIIMYIHVSHTALAAILECGVLFWVAQGTAHLKANILRACILQVPHALLFCANK